MKKIIILLAAIVLTSNVRGQENKVNIGLEGSPSAIFLYGNEILKQYRQLGFGYSGGIFFQYNLPKILSIRTNIAYEHKGQKDKFTLTDQSGNVVGEQIAHINFDYITAPVLLRATFGKKVKFFINGGAFFGYLISMTESFDSDTPSLATSTNDNTYNFKHFDVGIASGLGIALPIKKKLLFSLELRNNTGLYNTSKLPVYNKGSIRTNSTNLLISFAYKIGTRQAETK